MKNYNYSPPQMINLEDSVKEFVEHYEDIDADLKTKVLDVYASTYNPVCGYFAVCYS